MISFCLFFFSGEKDIQSEDDDDESGRSPPLISDIPVEINMKTPKAADMMIGYATTSG